MNWLIPKYTDMATYTHFAKQPDVLKHLILCEVLKNETPQVYVETNSACAIYPMTQTPEQQYGIYHFLKKADEVLQQGIQGITDLINVPSLINLDFADIQTVMKDKGIAHIGIGAGRGDDKALEAVKQAVASPLLETTIQGASNVIVNVSGDITLMDASDAADYVQELAGESASIIFGAMYDDTKSDECTITVIATGLHNVGGSASKLKARLEGQQKVGSILPSGGESHVRSTLDHERRAGSTVRPQGGTMPTLQPRTPSSNVKEQSIKIPDFFKK